MTHAAILLIALLATDVSRARTLTVPRSIERTVVRLAVGLAATYGDKAKLPSVAELMEGDLGQATVSDARLLVDGERTGTSLRRVLRGLATLGLLVLDRAHPGASVELRYTLHYRGLAIERQVIAREGQIVSRASFPCALGPQGRVRHVWFAATATETDAGATIRLTATVRVNTGLRAARSRSRCKLVNRVAIGAVRRQLDATLSQVERDGRRLAVAGHDALWAMTGRFVCLLANWTR